MSTAIPTSTSKPSPLTPAERKAYILLAASKDRTPDEERQFQMLLKIKTANDNAKKEDAKAKRTPRINELVSVFFLVFVGCSVVIQAATKQPIAGAPVSSLAVPAAFGGILMVLAYRYNCDANPTITLAKAINKDIPWSQAFAKMFFQLVGAILAGVCLLLAWGPQALGFDLGATHPAAGVGFLHATFMETLFMFILARVVIFMSSKAALGFAMLAGVFAGLTLFIGILVDGPQTGGAINFIRAFGPMAVSAWFKGMSSFQGIGSYALAAVLAGILAGLWARRGKKQDPATA